MFETSQRRIQTNYMKLSRLALMLFAVIFISACEGDDPGNGELGGEGYTNDPTQTAGGPRNGGTTEATWGILAGIRQFGQDFVTGAVAKYPDGKSAIVVTTLDTNGALRSAYSVDFNSSYKDLAMNAVEIKGDNTFFGGTANGKFLIAKINSKGELLGTITTVFPGRASVHSMQFLTDGSILAAGVDDNRLALAKYKADGSLDTAFGTGGMSTTLLPAGLTPKGLVRLSREPGGYIYLGTEVNGGLVGKMTIEIQQFSPSGQPRETSERVLVHSGEADTELRGLIPYGSTNTTFAYGSAGDYAFVTNGIYYFYRGFTDFSNLAGVDLKGAKSTVTDYAVPPLACGACPPTIIVAVLMQTVFHGSALNLFSLTWPTMGFKNMPRPPLTLYPFDYVSTVTPIAFAHRFYNQGTLEGAMLKITPFQ